jgi:hypothetical protein
LGEHHRHLEAADATGIAGTGPEAAAGWLSGGMAGRGRRPAPHLASTFPFIGHGKT